MSKPSKRNRPSRLPVKSPAPPLVQGEIIAPDTTKQELKTAIRSLRIEMSKSEHFSGPLPPPRLLREFDEVVPGCAKIMVDTFVAQSNHRMHLEKTVIEGDSKRANWGVLCALIIALSGMVIAGLLIQNGMGTLGAVYGFANLAGLVSVFIYGTRSRARERQERVQKMSEAAESQKEK